ncbi:MAG TPA: MtrAB system histidine kinase MtrB [Micromonosporaceae bacterium]
MSHLDDLLNLADRMRAAPTSRRVRRALRAVRLGVSRVAPGPATVVAQRATLLWAALRRAWRRSLQLRIVTLTLLLSGLLVAAFGVLVARNITHGLLEAKQRSAHEQVLNGGQYAMRQLSTITDPDDPALLPTLTDIPAKLASPPEQGSGALVVIVPEGLRVDTRLLPNQDKLGAVPTALRSKVTAEGKIYRQRLNADPDGRGRRPYLVYGEPIPVPSTLSGSAFQLYYLFPLDDEVQAVDVVRNTVIITGLALVILLAFIAALVTRLVVRPVRQAARTAQRLSAGLLDQRMEVRGEDDLARLAASFNQMAANLQRQIVRLEEMSRLQRRFTSDVSHELRTPLTTVRMAADLIHSSRDELDPAMARAAELLHDELDRFEELLTDLLEISRFDAGFAALDAEPADVVGIVHRVVERLAPVADRAGVRVELDVPDGDVIAEVDPRRVERVLRNLVGNAIEHGERQPVRITVRVDDAAVAVTVRDHGVGLKPGEEKLVFNRFWRADPSRARQTGGTGLGLSISLEDARLHGGWLEAWGAPGQGAQFRLTLPVRAGARLVSSPLRLVPDDARLATDEPVRPTVEPGQPGTRALPAPVPATPVALPAATTPRTRPAAVGGDGG